MAENIPREFIESLLSRIDIIALIQTYLPLKKKSAQNYFACCPFHQEKSASFSASQQKQFYYCFGCGAHGNAIDFVMAYDRLNFPEAVEVLARQQGMPVPKTAMIQKKNSALPTLYELLEKVSAFYYEQLRTAPRAIDYLKERGISGHTAKQFQLGYAREGWSPVIDHFGKDEKTLKQLEATGLIIRKDQQRFYDRFRDRIMFPIIDYRGRVVGFGGRVIDQGEPKYLNSPETALFQKSHELYGLYQALQVHRQLERVLIVEGYMDVIALFQQGICYAVATLGTATSKFHLQKLIRYTKEIVFCFDGDQAGRTAAWRALECALPLMEADLQVRFMFLPDGEDPDSMVMKEGKDAFEARLANAESLSQFFLQTLTKQHDMATLEGRSSFAMAALHYIRRLENGLFQNLLLEAVARTARIAPDQLQHQLVDKREATPAAAAQQVVNQNAVLTLVAPLKLALTLLLQHPELVHIIPDLSALHGVPNIALLTELTEKLQRAPDASLALLLEDFRDRGCYATLIQLAQAPHQFTEANLEQGLLDALAQLQQLPLDSDINHLMALQSAGQLDTAGKQKLLSLIAKRKKLPV